MNPYYDRRYGGILSFTQGMIDAQREYQEMRYKMGQAEIMRQYRQSVMAQHGRDKAMFDIKYERELEKQKVLEDAEKDPDFEVKPFHNLLFNRNVTNINIDKPATPGTVKTIADIIRDNLAATTDPKTKKITKKGINQAKETTKRQLPQAGQDDQIDAIFDGELEKLKSLGYTIEEDKTTDTSSFWNLGPSYAKAKMALSGFKSLFTGGNIQTPDTEESKVLDIGKGDFIPDDTRLYVEPDWVGQQTGWMKLPEELRKEIWTVPKTEREFVNTLRKLQTANYDIAKKYYDQYLDRFY